MGFGDMKTTEQATKTQTLPPWLSNAAQYNVNNAAGVTNQPFTPYTAPRVAPLTPDQNTSADMLRTAAGSGNPYADQIKALYDKFANTPGANISLPSILGPNADARTSSIQDYMNPYVDAALRPQLQALDRQDAANRQRLNANATFSGAFGDARHGVEDAANTRDMDILRNNTIGTGYSNAFTNAAGLRSQDLNNLFNTQTANANFGEQALQRAATGGTDLMNLDKYNTGRTVDLADQLDKSGNEQRTAQQQQLDANYQEFMRKLGYPADMIKLFSSVLAASPGNKEGTVDSTTQKPDNSGYGILGSLAGPALSFGLAPFTGGASLAALPLTAPGNGSNYAGLGGWT